MSTPPAGDATGAATGAATGDASPAGRWRTRNVLVLSGVSLLQDAASELLYPILPIFLTTVLAAPATAVGLTEGLGAGAAAVTSWGAGQWAYRYRRRSMVAVGYGAAALGKIIVAVATIWPVVLVGRVVDRLGKGVRGAPRDALLVDGVPPGQRGRAFGLHRTADTLGAVIGPLIGIIGYELLHHQLRPLLVLATIPALASVGLVAAVRDRSGATRRSSTRPGQNAEADTDTRAALPRPFWRVCVLIGVFAVVNTPDALLLLRLHDIGFGVPLLLLAYLGYNLVYAAASLPAGAAADRWHPSRVFGVGLLLFAACYLTLGITRDHTIAWVMISVYGLYSAATDGVGKAWVSRLVPPASQAYAQGTYQAVSGAGVLAAGLWAGLAWHSDGHLPLIICGVVAAFVAVVALTAGTHEET